MLWTEPKGLANLWSARHLSSLDRECCRNPVGLLGRLRLRVPMRPLEKVEGGQGECVGKGTVQERWAWTGGMVSGCQLRTHS